MVLILVEASYTDSIWCVNLLEGLIVRLKQKRISFRQIHSLDEVGPNDDFIYLIGTNNQWQEAALKACNSMGIYPILLGNQAQHSFHAEYSTVCLDVVNSMQWLIELLAGMGMRRVALYGVNPMSSADDARQEGYLAGIARQGITRGKSDIFYNSGSLQTCFDVFSRRQHEYDAVICVNELAAVSLVRHLGFKEYNQTLPLIISCADSWLSQFYTGKLLQIRGNFDARARASVELLESLRRNPDLSHIIMTVRLDPSDLRYGIPQPLPQPAAPVSKTLPHIQDVFYEDAELNEMMALERLLRESSQADRMILRGLLRGDTYQNIAETCFFTESAIKYRVKKMVRICKVRGRGELCSLLKKYLPDPSQLV